MKSILENRPALAAEVNKVAEVAGYLWQKGWAERNARFGPLADGKRFGHPHSG